ncbi:MAG: porin [Xanthobacteraceae bacterium]|nr:porin [Xanthobacteraceae bacterium]
MNKTVLALSTVLLMSVPALAADLRMPVKAPIAASVYNWSGLYVGGFVGIAAADRKAASTTSCIIGGVCVSGPVAGPDHVYSLGSGFIGGATLGYNWQTPGSNWVYGLEAEAGYLNLKHTSRIPNAPVVTPLVDDTTQFGDFYGIVAGRIGYAFGRVLVYGKAGVAFVEKSSAFEFNGGTGVSFTASHDDAQITWALGAGAEWALTEKWSLKGEYLYINTRETYTISGTINGGPFNGLASTHVHTDPGTHTGKIGLNYHF